MGAKHTVHVCKFDPQGASRLHLQMSWDSSPRCLSLSHASSIRIEIDKPEIPNEHLSWLTLVGNLFRQKGSTFVFHKFSLMPHLIVSWGIIKVFRHSSRIVYDIHDLLEYIQPRSLYGYLRFYILYMLELLAFRCSNAIMTVSDGIAEIYALRHSRRPKVVMSIPARDNGKAPFPRRSNSALVYFGQLKSGRLDLGFLRTLRELGLTMHLSGFWVEGHVPRDISPFISAGTLICLGPFTPNHLEFLSGYTHLVMTFSGGRNIESCLPNKMFQAFRQGLIVLGSDNLIEARKLFSIHEDIFITINTEDHHSILANLRPMNYEQYTRINSYLDVLYSDAMGRYLAATGSVGFCRAEEMRKEQPCEGC